jgi:nicotinate-nucleotide adenylyltransferase
VDGENIGILGGTFDPIHVGHLLAAQDTMEALTLDRVIFVTASIPPHKTGKGISPAETRLAMVKLAVENNPSFYASDIEIRRSGPSFSVDTVEDLKCNFPNSEFFFLVGEDNLPEIWAWKEPERLFGLCRMVVIGRPGGRNPARDMDLPGPVITLNIHRIDLSSSEIRRRVREGRSIRYLVPSDVERYIYEKRLYR